jgi:16S rRNA (guanine(966)-N(2))-methyltransferase RsmD
VSGSRTRPTTDRARAGLFDALGPRVIGARVLDLFAGTGALGIEALSRGARHCTFVERDRRACAVLRENFAQLELTSVSEVLSMPVGSAVRQLVGAGERFDLILADPPYGDPSVQKLLSPDALPQLLEPDGLLVVERDQRDLGPEDSGPLVVAGSRSYGETRFDRYAKEAEVDE